jgi:hypothetical protein
MARAPYAVPQAAHYLLLPSEPQAEIQRRLLDEYLRNPFLDDEPTAMALRTGLTRDEVEQGLEALCRRGLLRQSGRSGHALCLAELDPPCLPAAADSDGSTDDLSPGAEREAGASRATPDAVPAGEETQDDRLTGPGVIVLRADGRALLVDRRAAAWLGADAGDIDTALFRERTGIDPDWLLAGAPRLSFTLTRPAPLVVSLELCSLGSEPGVLVVIQDAGAQALMGAAQVQLQEELFAHLRAKVSHPIMLIQKFLDNPDADGLEHARAALAQINGFLDHYFLSASSGPAGDAEESN